MESHKSAVDEYFGQVSSYWTSIYDSNTVDGAIYRLREDRVHDWTDSLRLPASAPVLEIGCGSGRTTMALAKRGFTVAAIDSVESMVDIATRRVREEGAGNATVAVGDACSLNERDRSVRLVIAIGVLPWLERPADAVCEIARVLEPGGHAILSADNGARLSYLLDPRFNPVSVPAKRLLKRAILRLGLWANRPETFSRSHRIGEIDALVARAGLVKVAGETVGFGPFTFLGHALLPTRAGLRVHEFLQRLADKGVPVLRAGGSNYLVLARKP